MIEKTGNVVIVEDDTADFAAVLAEIGMPEGVSPTEPKATEALRETLKTLVDHPFNQFEGESSAFVIGTRVHFRFKKTLYTVLTSALGLAISAIVASKAPGIGVPKLLVDVVEAIRKVGEQFKKLTAQEFTVVGALAEACAGNKAATASEVEEVFLRNKSAPPAVPATLAKLARERVLAADPRDGDIYYSIVF